MHMVSYHYIAEYVIISESLMVTEEWAKGLDGDRGVSQGDVGSF